jgi:chorismate mutase
LTLEQARSDIDSIDEQIMSLLEKRFKLVLGMKAFKTTLSDEKRENLILSKTSSKYIQNIYKEIFRNSKKLLVEQGFSKSE